MNLKKSGYLISKFINYFGLFLLVPLVVFLFPIENLSDKPLYNQAVPFILSSLLTLILGLALTKIFNDPSSVKEDLSRKDGFLLASMIWLMAGLLGSLPYIFSSINLFSFASSGETT